MDIKDLSDKYSDSVVDNLLALMNINDNTEYILKELIAQTFTDGAKMVSGAITDVLLCLNKK